MQKGRTRTQRRGIVDSLANLVIGTLAFRVDVFDFCGLRVALKQTETNVDIPIPPAIPGDRRSTSPAELSDRAARRSVRRQRLLRIGDLQRLPRDADKGTMHAVVLPALGTMAEIGVVEITREQKRNRATKTRAAMLPSARQTIPRSSKNPRPDAASRASGREASAGSREAPHPCR